MGRPLNNKLVSTIKPRIPAELLDVLAQEFELFRVDKELEGLVVTQTDFLNWIIIKHLREVKSQILESKSMIKEGVK